jgi:hypothetical protein
MEAGLEESVLMYKLPLKDRLSLEWSWREEPSRGRMECTILTHITIGTNAINIQNKRHLHWKVLDSIMEMNNEVEFTAPAHNLLLKFGTPGEDKQGYKSRVANICQHSGLPQVVRKKHFTRLDL